MVAGARPLGEVSINVAECLALRDALWMARCRGLQRIMVEGNSKLIIEAVRGTSGVPWRVRSIIEDIKFITGSFKLFSWNHVYREANFVADFVTDTDFQYGNLHIWDMSLTPVANRALLFDRLGLGSTRGFSL